MDMKILLKLVMLVLKKLGLDYVDLYLIHWPGTNKEIPPNEISKLRNDTWKGLEKLHKDGKAKSIGVSNYTIKHLKELIPNCEFMPSVNQVEFHPKLYQSDLLEHCKSEEIVLEGYSPFGKGKLLKNETVKRIAENYKKTPAQVLIRWNLQHEVVVIPKCSTVERLKENMDVFNFEISSQHMKELDSLNENWHSSWNPNDIA